MKPSTQILLAHAGFWLSTGIILAAMLPGNSSVPVERKRTPMREYELPQYYGPAELIRDQGRRFLRNNQAGG